MNPLWVYQYLISQGMQPQQAWAMSQQFGGMGGAGATGANPSGGSSGGGLTDILSQLAMLYQGAQGINTLKQPWNLQMQAANTGMNPGLLNQRIQALTKPLSNQLVKSVTRATTPGIAEAGLATSPGMSQQIIAEALAPYQIQEQQMGQNAAFQGMQPAFQVGSGAAGSYPSAGVDLVELMRMMGSGGGYP